MPRFPYKRYLKYPHLRPEDVKVWNLFISQNPDFFKAVEYDVKVGEGREYPDSPEGPIKEDMKYLSKKRIDVVGFMNHEIYVIELKPKAEMRAIGQALSLAELYRDIAPSDRIVLPTVITDEEMPDTRRLCSKLDVLYLVCS